MLHKPRVKEAVEQAWKSQDQRGGATVSERIRLCRKALSKWKKENSTNSLDHINQIHSALEVEQSASWPCFDQINIFKEEIGSCI